MTVPASYVCKMWLGCCGKLQKLDAKIKCKLVCLSPVPLKSWKSVFRNKSQVTIDRNIWIHQGFRLSVGSDKISLFFIFSSSSSCSAGWKQGRTPWGYQWSGNRSCCLSHQGSGGSPLRSCLTWVPRRHHCPAHRALRHCLLRSPEAPFSRGPDSKEGKHLPLYLEMEEEHITSGKPRLAPSTMNIPSRAEWQPVSSVYADSPWLENMV